MFVNHPGQWTDFAGKSGPGRNHRVLGSDHRCCWPPRILHDLPCKKWCRWGGSHRSTLSGRHWSSWHCCQGPYWPTHIASPWWPRTHLTPPCHNPWSDFPPTGSNQLQGARAPRCSWRKSATKPLKPLLSMLLHLARNSGSKNGLFCPVQMSCLILESSHIKWYSSDTQNISKMWCSVLS